MKKLNNKGVALVTVLITMTFATILATSLIYMAYMNYVMKSMRFSSTDNFYTAEFALDDLAMAMQQLAAEKSSAAEAVAALCTSVGENYDNGCQQYDNEHVKAMIQVASREASISVNTIYESEQNLFTTSNSVELKGLEITSVTASGYKSTIVTDLKIAFPSSNLGDLDINDFSVLTDSPIVVEAGNCYFTGCVFIGDGDPDNVTNALTIKGGSTVHILSPRGVINGNIRVESGATLIVTGTVSVVGKINLANDATLICTDALQVREGVSSTGTVKGASRSDITKADMNVSAVPNDLIDQLIVPVWMYYSGGWHEVTLRNLVDGWGGVGKKGETSTGVNVYFGLNTTNGIEHNLILTPNPVEIRNAMTDSTIIANGAITVGVGGGSKSTIMQRLSDEDYEFAKSSFLGILEGEGYYGPGGNIRFPSSGKAPDDIPDNPEHEKDVTISTSCGGRTYEYEVTYACGSSPNSNYISIGSFINEKSSEMLTDMMGNLQGDAAASTSVISIYNWSKE